MREADCEKIFTDRMTGSRLDRPGWDQMMVENARILYENSGKTAAEVCAAASVGRRTLFSYLAKLKKAHASGSEGAL